MSLQDPNVVNPARKWRPFAIRDGNLITGQRNFSRAATAELLVQALGR